MIKSDNQMNPKQGGGIKWKLAVYDGVVLALVSLLINWLHPGETTVAPVADLALQTGLALLCILGVRLMFRSYHQIWRYADTSCYIQLILCDAVGGLFYYSLQRMILVEKFSFLRIICTVCLNLLVGIMMRLMYQYLYDCSLAMSGGYAWFRKIVSWFTGLNIEQEKKAHQQQQRKINIAVVGAGRVGVMLAEELLNNPNASYVPSCFIDVDQGKVGRYIYGVEVLSEEQATLDRLAGMAVQEIVFAIPSASAEKKKHLYETYQATGCRLKTYDFPVTQAVSATGKGRRQLRSFDPQELLFREVKDFTNDETRAYYKGKTVLISGGGGSIGSELSRQIAKMDPKRLVILDVYENCAYDIQQELKIAYGQSLDLQVEILSICDYDQLDTIFAKYRPDVVLHAAAHKHVPLMEHNCCEAIKNNVFGTWNIVRLSEKYNVEKFIMISTDKAVNPTNAMGATKRMCEMIVQSEKKGTTKFSATRFGNVLGSNGSVIPLFRRQIEGGGPVTITDRNIIRYFMTIPEASQLVLTSGAMADNGELYVLDMGKPVKILDLAENMIRLSGFEPYKDIDIIETGLRPGEKLYEELLIKTEELDKTDNSMIFVERDQPLTQEQLLEKLEILRKAVETEDNDICRDALKQVVPTYHAPEEVNADAAKAKEMHNVRKVQPVETEPV